MPHHPALTPLIAALKDTLDPCQTALDALPDILSSSDWLPSSLLTADPAGYRRELLHQAPDGSYSIGCFVWAPGQKTRIHDHTCWGAIGVMAGRLRERSFTLSGDGALNAGESRLIGPGDVASCQPGADDIHEVGSAAEEISISLHIYGSAFDRICRTLYDGETA